MHHVRELSSQGGELRIEDDFQPTKEGTTSNEEDTTNPIESANTSSSRTSSSPVRRPLTRSQTGTVTKRRRPDETPLSELRQRSTRRPKKIKETSDKAGEASSNIHYKGDMVAIPRQISAPKGDDMHAPSKALTVETPIDQPGSRLRANLPTPVPNLTKKSRGRRVPTKLGRDAGTPDNPKDATRMYVCKVENCGKCFHRGEHLKRHIRSIHTHEKPFKCTYPSCNKHFNRHDNLLQHLKVHRDLATSETSAADDFGSPVELRRISPSPLSVEPPPSQLQPYYPSHNSYETSVKQAQTSTEFRQSPALSYCSYDASYASISEPLSFRTNMAVSSVRTEIPQSPPKTP